MPDQYERYSHVQLGRPHPRGLRITMKRHDRLNAIDQPTHSELAEICRDIDADPDTSAVIVTGAGRTFSAADDIDTASDLASDFTKCCQGWKEARDLVYNMVNCSKPIVGAIRRPTVGAGLTVGVLADISIAAKGPRLEHFPAKCAAVRRRKCDKCKNLERVSDSKATETALVDGHTKLGVSAGDHTCITWPLLCGMAKAKYYLLLYDTLTGEEAERIGLVSIAVEDADLDATARKVAMRLAEGAPTAVRGTKYALNNWMRSAGPTFDTSLALEFLAFTGPDVREGISAICEKRPPSFNSASPL